MSILLGVTEEKVRMPIPSLAFCLDPFLVVQALLPRSDNALTQSITLPYVSEAAKQGQSQSLMVSKTRQTQPWVRMTKLKMRS